VIDGVDGTHWTLDNKGTKAPLKLASVSRNMAGGGYQSVQYAVFQRAMLLALLEIDPASLVGDGKDQAAAGRLEDVQERLEACKAQIEGVQAEMLENPRLKGLVKVLTQLEAKQEKLLAEYQQVRQEVSSPLMEGMSEAKSLVRVLMANNTPEVRRKFRAKVATLVESVTIWLEGGDPTRLIHLTIRFKHSAFRRMVAVKHTRAKCGRGYQYPEVMKVSFFDVTGNLQEPWWESKGYEIDPSMTADEVEDTLMRAKVVQHR
jgi:hypothetical protein